MKLDLYIMKASKSFIIVTAVVFAVLSSCTVGGKRSVAIVADSGVIQHNADALVLYAASIEADGIRAFIIEDVWGVPDSIREVLKELYVKEHLEGAVFVGDIPIPMVRNGQHLTTAFKMDQSRPWEQSSVPSDRFYDDFDLEFDFLKRDSTYSLYYYYNLSPKGRQSVNSDIYSARIKPPVYDGKTRYELLDDYFQKIVEDKKTARSISQVTYFAGHGYNSDCMVARADEKIALTSQFSTLASGEGNLTFIDHTYDDYVRARLMAELTRKDLDLAILHHHGGDDMQYLNGTPRSNLTSQWLEMSKRFFRSRIRRSKDPQGTMKYYMDQYNVPRSWVSNAFDPALSKQDSLLDAMTDIHIKDMDGYAPAVPFIMLDACFTGSFHLDDYISGHYIFNPGHTVVVKANSVNSLQDIWPDQLIGLLELGVSVGNWARDLFTLESHLIGDPTYRYAAARKDLASLDYAVSQKKNKVRTWKKYLKDAHPEVRGLAMKMLFKNKALTYEDLLHIQKSDPLPVIRLMAFDIIGKKNNPVLVEAIKAGLYDNHEMIRRFAAKKAAVNQAPELLSHVVPMGMQPGISKRVEFNITTAVMQYAKDEVLTLFDESLNDWEGAWAEELAKQREYLERRLTSSENDFSNLMTPDAKSLNKRLTLSALRNSNNITYLDTLFHFMEYSKEDNLRLTLAEAFAWYTCSWKKDEIIDFCRNQEAIEENETIKDQLQRTLARLLD